MLPPPFPSASVRPFAALLGLLSLGIGNAAAQAPRAAQDIPAATAPARPSHPALDALRQREQELEAVRSEQRKGIDNEAKLKRDIDLIAEERRKLNQQLIDTAARVRAVEDLIAGTQDRLKPLDDREQSLRQSIEGRRNVIAEVLAALQRIGRHPPAAILVRPEDALESVRSAMLLGAVLPEMRHETEVLVGELAELVRLRAEIAEERARLTRDLAALAEERQQLTLLTEQRRKNQGDVEKTLVAERQRAVALARQADTLKDLIVGLEQGMDPATRARRAAARADEEKKALDRRPDLAALKDAGRLTPAVAFTAARGLLPLPVNGVRVREYGAADGLGGAERGLSIATRPGVQIIAPCDGWVVFAGLFRNYGQLLILDAGGGYHVLLAGMDKISVDQGQFVVTGEPVAVMGSGMQAPAAFTSGSGRPVLYVEFRKDGTPVDPGPWWAKNEGEKVRG
jgi:septal ring factor EnvC (AmiA/AmiB activator)